MNRSARYAPESRGTTAILIGLVALGAISTDLYLPSLPAIGDDLGADTAATQLTLSAFLAGFALAQLAIGPVSDRFGRRPVLIAGAATYTLAAAACALAPSIESLIGARTVQAIGACAGVVVGRAVVRDIYGRERAARMLALIGSAMGLLPAIGPVLGGFIVEWFGWRWNFVLLALFGAAVLVGVWRGLEESNRWRETNALNPLRLVANYRALIAHREFVGYALCVTFSYSGLFAFISGSSFVLIDGYGVGAAHFGFFFGGAVLGFIAGTQIAAKLTLKLGIERMVLAGALVSLAGGASMAGLAWLGLAPRGYSGAILITLPMVVYMAGMGIVLPNANAGALGPFPQMAGAASALTGFLQMGVASLLGIAVGHLHDGTARPMATLILMAAVATVVTYFALVRTAARGR